MNNNLALKDLIYRIADDQLVIGHRYSEWIGIGPVLEEDIALGSLAQDKVGHAYNMYSLLHELGEANPDKLAFHRTTSEFKCCHLVELPSQDYAFTLIRHFLFDNAEYIRFELLSTSAYQPLANLAKKYRPEIKYHVFHANTWIKQLSTATEESKARMQSALNEAWPLALGIFEAGAFENDLISSGLFVGEEALKNKWKEHIINLLESFGLNVPAEKDENTGFGGRKGYHTEHLEPMLKEMAEVISSGMGSEW